MTDTAQANGETFNGGEQTYHRCECGLWSSLLEDGNYESTRCDKAVPGDRTFAQGHDAKLKSLLIEAGVRGLEVTRHGDREGTADRVFTEGYAAAERFGFAHQVYDGIQAGKAKAEKRKERESAKALAKTTKAVKKRKLEAVKNAVEIKVGRWKYHVVEETAGTYVYIDSKGQEHTIEKSKAQVL